MCTGAGLPPTFSSPPLRPNRYRVTLTLWGSTANPVVELVSAPAVSLTKTMPAGKAYQATLEATNGATWSVASSPIGPLVVGRPGAVAKPGATGGSGEIALSWTAAAADPYPAGTTYWAKASPLLFNGGLGCVCMHMRRVPRMHWSGPAAAPPRQGGSRLLSPTPPACPALPWLACRCMLPMGSCGWAPWR